MPSGKTVDKVLRRDAFPIPDNTNPVGTRCIQILIPDDVQWEQTFFACLTLLTKWNSFQQDGAHLAADIASVWRNVVWNNMSLCDGTPIRIPFDEMGVDMSICEQLRFNPETGKFEGLCCGEWTPIDGQDGITFGGPGQDGGGTPQAPAGGCQKYHAQFSARDLYLVPTVVNAGDTLTFTNVSGAGSDGTARWSCPDGSQFFAGGCISGTTYTDAGDPAPSLPHESLIAKIGAVYYPASSGTITVPGSISNAQVTIQMNDASLSDNSGSYALDVEVCNNALTGWTHIFHFALETGGFTTYNLTGWLPLTWGQWLAGTGWSGTASANAGGGTHNHGIAIIKTFPHVTINTASLEWQLTKGTILTGLTNGLYLERSGSNMATATHAADTETNGAKVYTITPGSYDTDTIEIVVHDSYYVSGSDGTSVLGTLTLTGPGSDPF